MGQYFRQAMLGTLLILSATACGSGQIGAQAQTQAAGDLPPMREHGVTIYGYNYTNRAIGSFEVNGHGGGNLSVSSPTAGGGSSVCCATVFAPTTVSLPYTIKWTQEADIWCEQTVELPPLEIADPKYLEVHFYPDGHIELAATRDASPPRLKLERARQFGRHANSEKNTTVVHETTRCRDGYY